MISHCLLDSSDFTSTAGSYLVKYWNAVRILIGFLLWAMAVSIKQTFEVCATELTLQNILQELWKNSENRNGLNLIRLPWT